MRRGAWAAVALASYVAVAASLAAFGPSTHVRGLSGRFGLPEERPGVTPAAISIFLGRIGVSGRLAYQRALVVNLAAPVLFVVAGWLIVDWARTRAPQLRVMGSIVTRLLVLFAAIQLIENLLLLSAIASYPGRPPLGGLIGVIVRAKFVVFAVCCASLVIVSTDLAVSRRTSAGLALSRFRGRCRLVTRGGRLLSAHRGDQAIVLRHDDVPSVIALDVLAAVAPHGPA